jgi:hypothetical protein
MQLYSMKEEMSFLLGVVEGNVKIDLKSLV